MSINFSLAQKLSTCQNPTFVDTTNLVNKLNSVFDNNNEKTNIIINFFYIERLCISYLLIRTIFLLPTKQPRLIL